MKGRERCIECPEAEAKITLAGIWCLARNPMLGPKTGAAGKRTEGHKDTPDGNQYRREYIYPLFLTFSRFLGPSDPLSQKLALVQSGPG